MKSDDTGAVRRRGLVPILGAATAGIVVIGAVAVLATYTIHRRPSGVVLANAGGSSTAGTTDDGNRDQARAEAQALLDATPLPAGAVSVESSPVPVLDHADQGGPLEQDTTLDRVAWWTMPVSTSDFAVHLAADPPAGLTKSGSASGSITDTHAGTEVSWTEQEFTGKGTDAYTPPQLWLTWSPFDGGTALRAEVYIGARWPRPRTSLVTGRIASVGVRITGGTRPVSTSYTRRTTLTRLRTLFNGLPGAIHNKGQSLSMSCPAMTSPPPATTVVFRLANSDVVRAHETDGCIASLQVRRNGKRVRPPLDPSGFAGGIAAIVK